MRTDDAALRRRGFIAPLQRVDDRSDEAGCGLHLSSVLYSRLSFSAVKASVCVLNSNLADNGRLYCTVTLLSDLHPCTRPLLLPTKAQP